MRERSNYLGMAAVIVSVVLVMLSPLMEIITPLGSTVGLTQSLYQLLYCIWVPALAFCAGIMADKRRASGASLGESALLMLFIYAAVQWVNWGIYKVFFTTDEAFRFFYPKEGLWLLLAVACWLFTVHLCRRMTFRHILCVALVFGVLAGLLDFLDEIPIFGQIVVYFPFFLFGLGGGDLLKKELSRKGRLFVLTGLLLLCVGLLVSRIWISAFPVYRGEVSYSRMLLGAVSGCLLRFIWYGAAFFSLWGFMKVLPERKTIWSAMGGHSLLAYIVGVLLVRHIIECHSIFYNNLVYAWNYYGPLVMGVGIAALVYLPLLKKPYDWLAQAGNRLLVRMKESELLRGTGGERNARQVCSTCRVRLVLSLVVSFFLTFTLLIFAPAELYLANHNYLNFAFEDLYPVLVGFGLGTFILLLAILNICRGQVFVYGATFLFGLTLCSYLQGNFWNGNLGTLDGTKVPWESYHVEMALNGLLWLFMFALLFWLCRKYAALWKRVLCVGSLLLSAMQLSALVALLLNTDLQARETAYFDVENEFVLSEEGNVIVFILDHFDNELLDEILSESPDFLEPLTGFTYYHNMVSRYVRTFPAVAYLLSGEDYFFDIPSEEWQKQIFEDNDFWQRIGEQGYQGRVFVSAQFTIGRASYLSPYADNVKFDLKKPKPTALFGKMMQLASYRNAPLFGKKFFWMYTEDMNALVRDGYRTDDKIFFDDLRKKGLALKNEPPNFIFYHLNGAHPPFRLDSEGNYVDRMTTAQEAGRGAMTMVFEYIRQMKELGIYDNSSIIITADHGEVRNQGELTETTNPILFVKPAGIAAGAGCLVSEAPVSHANFFDTVLTLMGDMDAHDAVMDVGEDAKQEPRYLYRSVSDPEAKKEDYQLETWEIIGDANDFSCWERIDVQNNKYSFY